MSFKTKIQGLFKLFILLPICALLSQSVAAEDNHDWQQLKPGLYYQDIGRELLTPWSHIHVFKISPHQYQMGLSLAKDLNKQNASIDELAQAEQALIAINGGFFDQNFKSLGLRIHKNKQISPYKPISWWGVFMIKYQRPKIISAKAFYPAKDISFAIQAGPRLIVDGRIPPLKPGQAERSALGINKHGQIIIVVTDKATMSTTELATLMKNPPLSCTDALNLDGGSSSALYANIGDFRLNVHGFSNVSDAVIVTAR